MYAIGAPQRHGQNLYKQNIATYSQELAGDIDGYDTDAFQKGVISLKLKLVDFSIKMSHLLTHHIQVNNIGICMERTQQIDIVQTF